MIITNKKILKESHSKNKSCKMIVHFFKDVKGWIS